MRPGSLPFPPLQLSPRSPDRGRCPAGCLWVGGVHRSRLVWTVSRLCLSSLLAAVYGFPSALLPVVFRSSRVNDFSARQELECDGSDPLGLQIPKSFSFRAVKREKSSAPRSCTNTGLVSLGSILYLFITPDPFFLLALQLDGFILTIGIIGFSRVFVLILNQYLLIYDPGHPSRLRVNTYSRMY